MTSDNIKKLHAHFSRLAKGDFTARDFDTSTPEKNAGDEEGNMRMGKLTSERIALIKSDANVNKLEMEQMKDKNGSLSYPFLTEKPTPVEKPKAVKKNA